ncbi:Oxysterol-binding protein-domain-containing protein [Amanita rubescens]|nr:Oxysterol-binding protein-domain-containing protein [Amanita rubescens]
MASTRSTQSSSPPDTVADPVFHYPALIHPFLAEIGKDSTRPSDAPAALNTAAAAVHLAIRCASAQTVALLLSHRAIDPNGLHPPGSGTSPLHLAASLGRTDVVTLLLDQPDIDDSLYVIRAIDDSSYILSPLTNPPTVPHRSPPAKFIDLSYLDEDSGTSLLHEAARRKDLRLIELAVRAGADVFVRNRKGKTAYEGAGKDDPVRVFLRQYANHDNTLIHASPFDQLPTLKGYLNKYTNVAKGYSTRWFVLRGGILSYYRHQADETVTSRGSISMKNAVLKSTHDRLRFEVHSVPALQQDPLSPSNSSHVAGTASGQKWYLKANHPVEAARWIQAIERSIQYFAKEREGRLVGSSSDREDVTRRRSRESDASSLRPSTSGFPGASLLKKAAKSGGSVVREVRDFASLSRADVSVRSMSVGGHGHAIRDSVSMNAPEMVRAFESTPASPKMGQDGDEEDREDGYAFSTSYGGYETEDNASSAADSMTKNATGPPHELGFALHANSMTAQLELTAQLVSRMGLGTKGLSSVASLPSSSASASSASSTSLPAKHPSQPSQPHLQQQQQMQMQAAFSDSLTSLNSLVQEYIKMVSEREKWFRRRLGEEQGRQRLWEESLKVVVKEGEDLERELRARSRRRGSMFLGGIPGSGGGRRQSVVGWVDKTMSPVGSPPPEMTAPLQQSPQPLPPPLPPQPVVPEAERDQSSISVLTPIVTPLSSPQVRPIPKQSRRSSVSSTTCTTDEEDEFFDAIEANNLPNLVVNSSFTPSAGSSSSSMLLGLRSSDLPCYGGYTELRTDLAISADNRPSTSLWSVLKHSIGKDLTKISFPVFFNEPTSMLQRMAEDMEFSECLDAAAKESDPLRRIAYVGAFAMSNYSSTIGRIAKPFNPMLSETFEYVRLDKQYRYMSEQVSHHPPISACWAESPLWSYYGEVDAQNRFMGKSFEIRPTGVAHVELYPQPGVNETKEHYTWKKVTTNVSGFILGSPTIDHYGDMVVTNHRTGDRCVLTFKPRGWRGKDAFEITGQVVDARGNVAYDIAGRWNSQLVARPRGRSNGTLHPDMLIHASSSSDETEESDSSASEPEFILLWRNSEKPPGAPFNLTPYAITLNDCPRDTLRPYLAPTDCRLRPDQRAFELGKYELANSLKMMQEDKQRAVRKAREEGRVPPHRPRWFVAERDEDTGERVWRPVRVGEVLEYWVERERVFRDGGRWKDVEDIFIGEPEGIKGW